MRKNQAVELLPASRNGERRASVENELKGAELAASREKGVKKVRPASRRKKGGTMSGVVATHAYGANFKQLSGSSNPNLSGGLCKTLKFVHRNVSLGNGRGDK